MCGIEEDSKRSCVDQHEEMESAQVCGTDPQASEQIAAALARHLVPQAGRSL